MLDRPYQKEDYHLIKEWMEKRQKDIPKESRLPKWGIVVGECAMVFLVQTDCNVAILEYFITDPEASAEKRQLACDTGIKLAEEFALKEGYEVIAATVGVPRVAELLHSWRYIAEPKPYVIFKKLLGDPPNA